MSRAVRILTVRSTSAQGAGTEYSEWFLVEQYDELTPMVNVTAVSGTIPQLEVTLQTSDSNTASAKPYDIYPVKRLALSAVDQGAFTVRGFGKYVRTKGVVTGTGTPTVTHTIDIAAKT